jgi:hypothetical protein
VQWWCDGRRGRKNSSESGQERGGVRVELRAYG